MVALAEGGAVQAGWILDPVTRRMCHAVLGGGAFIDNQRIEARPTGGTQPIGALATRFLPAEIRAHVTARAEGHITIADIPNCAGEQYPRLVLGTNDLALFWRAMPWDHAPGALFLEEAGGRIARIRRQALLGGGRSPRPARGRLAQFVGRSGAAAVRLNGGPVRTGPLPDQLIRARLR